MMGYVNLRFLEAILFLELELSLKSLGIEAVARTVCWPESLSDCLHLIKRNIQLVLKQKLDLCSV